MLSYLGTPRQGTPRQGTPPGRVPPARVPPRLDLAGYPPWLPHGILGNVAKHYGIWVPPPDVNRLKTLPSPILRMRAVKRWCITRNRFLKPANWCPKPVTRTMCFAGPLMTSSVPNVCRNLIVYIYIANFCSMSSIFCAVCFYAVSF